MASHVYRFRSQGPNVVDVSKEVPGSVTYTAAGHWYVDFTTDSTLLADLTDAMASRGWTFDSTDPTTTPDGQAASNGENAINFQTGGTLVAKQPTLNFVSGATVVNNPGNNRVDVTIPTGISLASATPAAVSASAGAVGVGTTAARDDHTHQVTTGTPVDIGTANAAGSGPGLAKNDHVHNLPFSAVQTALGLASSAVGFNNQRLTGVLDPTGAQDAATKNYVDAVAQGIDVRASCRVGTTTALPAYTASGSGSTKILTSNTNGPLTVDTKLLAINERVLVKDQAASHVDHGIYYISQVGVGGSSPWILHRATDADSSAKVTSGMFTFLEEGSQAGNGWVLTTPNPITLESTALGFTQFSGAGEITAGAGLTKTGNTIDVIANADGSITVNANDIQVGILATDAQHGARGGGTQHATAVGGVSAGFISASDQTKLNNLPTTPANDSYVFGHTSIGTTTTTRYLPPGYTGNGTAPTTAVQFRVPRIGTIKSLRVHAGVAGSGASNLTYTVRKNSVATAVTCTFSNTVQDGSDLVNTASFAAGDLIDISVAKSAGISSSPTDVLATVEFAP